MFTYKEVIEGKLDLKKVKATDRHLDIGFSNDLFSVAIDGVKEIDNYYFVDYRWLEINLFLTTIINRTNLFELVKEGEDDASITELFDYITNKDVKDYLSANALFNNYNEIFNSITKTLESYCIGKNINAIIKVAEDTFEGTDEFAEQLVEIEESYKEIIDTLAGVTDSMAKPVEKPKKKTNKKSKKEVEKDE